MVIFVLIYVDDIIITGPNKLSIDSLMVLYKFILLVGLGPINFFLGIEALLVYEGLFLTRCWYVTDLLKRSNMSLAKLAITLRGFSTFGHYWRCVTQSNIT